MKKPESEDLPAINDLHLVTNDGRCMIHSLRIRGFLSYTRLHPDGFFYGIFSQKRDKCASTQFQLGGRKL